MIKKFIVMLMLSMLVACESSTNLGPCIGIVDTEQEDLVYEISIQNAIVTVIFIETIVVPIIWAIDCAKCPVARR